MELPNKYRWRMIFLLDRIPGQLAYSLPRVLKGKAWFIENRSLEVGSLVGHRVLDS